MHGWETRMLLRHYPEPGVSAELSRRFRVGPRKRRVTPFEMTITKELPRDVSRRGAGTPKPARVRHAMENRGSVDRRATRRPRVYSRV